MLKQEGAVGCLPRFPRYANITVMTAGFRICFKIFDSGHFGAVPPVMLEKRFPVVCLVWLSKLAFKFGFRSFSFHLSFKFSFSFNINVSFSFNLSFSFRFSFNFSYSDNVSIRCSFSFNLSFSFNFSFNFRFGFRNWLSKL